MKSATVDNRRRLVMPKACPPGSAVTIQQVDPETWIVKRRRPMKGVKVVLIPTIKRLTDDPEWEAEELRIARHSARRVPPFAE